MGLLKCGLNLDSFTVRVCFVNLTRPMLEDDALLPGSYIIYEASFELFTVIILSSLILDDGWVRYSALGRVTHNASLGTTVNFQKFHQQRRNQV